MGGWSGLDIKESSLFVFLAVGGEEVEAVGRSGEGKGFDLERGRGDK